MGGRPGDRRRGNRWLGQVVRWVGGQVDDHTSRGLTTTNQKKEKTAALTEEMEEEEEG